jgi:hypothetical protein
MTFSLTLFGLLLLDDNTYNGAANTAGGLAAMMAGFGLIWSLIVLALLVVGIIAYWRIAMKAGYAGALSLLMLVPILNFIIFLIFAFSEWPIEARLRMAGGGARTPSTT